jgi:hypothetical protein
MYYNPLFRNRSTVWKVFALSCQYIRKIVAVLSMGKSNSMNARGVFEVLRACDVRLTG